MGRQTQRRLRGARHTKVKDVTARSKPASTDAGEEEWPIEEITKHRMLDDSHQEYFVKWETGEETWEPFANLCQTQALQDYLAKTMQQ
jgi:hypothetical protein